MALSSYVQRFPLLLLAVLIAVLGTGAGLPQPRSPETGQPPDTWRAMSTVGAPSPRSYLATIWTGTEFIVWGGMGPIATWPQRTALYNDGDRYNPATATWRPMSTAGAPSPRMDAKDVWTGSKLIVWGGDDFATPSPFSPAMAGGIYDPVTDTWRPLPPSGLSQRGGSTVVWTGKELLVWGGYMATPAPTGDGLSWSSRSDGARYNPATNAWTPMATTGAPDGRYPGIWAGKELLVWSASDEIDQIGQHWPGRPGARYDPATNTWHPMSAVGAPPSTATTAVWTGKELLVWGGNTGRGARYDPTTNRWAPMSTVNAPAAPFQPTALWTGNRLLVWGGCCTPPKNGRGGFAEDGGLYDPVADRWTPIPGAPAAVASDTGAGGSVAVAWAGG